MLMGSIVQWPVLFYPIVQLAALPRPIVRQWLV